MSDISISCGFPTSREVKDQLWLIDSFSYLKNNKPKLKFMSSNKSIKYPAATKLLELREKIQLEA